jgi:hypothetical protein
MTAIIHWDYSLKAGETDVYILGMSREIHIMVGEALTHQQWRDRLKALTPEQRSEIARTAAVGLAPDKPTLAGTGERLLIFCLAGSQIDNRLRQLVRVARALGIAHGRIAPNVFATSPSKYTRATRPQAAA